MELSYWDRITLLECGFEENIMYNVYINEIVNYPNAFGCYKTNDIITAYFINERGDRIIEEYRDFSDFMLMFVRTAPNSSKYNIENKVL